MSVPPYLFLLIVGCAAADSPLPATGSVTTQMFASPTLGDDLLLRVRTPPGVDAEGAYPVIFQLDPTYAGLQEFDRTVGLVSAHEDDGTWPEAIVVGLDYEDPYDRERDYTPTEPLSDDFSNPDGADRFYAALRDDVLPHVEATLPVDPEFRVLQGHSKGGVFSWYAALRHRDGAAPLFAAHVAADAGIQEYLFTLERWHAEQATDLPVRLYASRAVLNGPIQQVAFDGLIERLEAREYPGLALETVALDTDHGGALTPSFEQGLDFVFEEAP